MSNKAGRWQTRLLAGVLAVSILKPLLADDLFDPAEAEKYRRKPTGLADELVRAAASQPGNLVATSRSDRGEVNRTGATSKPASPLQQIAVDRDDIMPGYLELSDGTICPGQIFTTREKAWSVYDATASVYRRIPPTIVRQIDAIVVWERDEKDWRWKENGSDEKVFTGRSYSARLTNYAFILVDGQKITGSVQQPIYVRRGDGDPVQFILHERDKGPLDSKLPQLIYVRHVFLGKEALTRGEALAAKRSASQPAGN
jgi:hypothetical protein